MIPNDFTQVSWMAVDPGQTSGWAMYTPGHFASGQVEDRFAFYDAFYEAVDRGWPLSLVVEAYDITPTTHQKTRQYDAFYIIGHLEGLAHQIGVPFVLSPRHKKAFSTDRKLKQVGWHNPTEGGHANDAARHLLAYVVTQSDPYVTKKMEEMLNES